MQKPQLLLLVHRIPFPPNKGDKIRSFNIMKELSASFDIHLGCFIDDPHDFGYESELLDYCRTVHCVGQNKWLCKLNGLTGFVRQQAITLPYYQSVSMNKWVGNTIVEHNIDKVLVFSAAMAQFVEPHMHRLQRTVLDFVDIDSDKWRQYASEKTGLKRWFYHREARLLADYETRMADVFDASTFVSEDEAQLFRSGVPALANKISGVRNGVDTVFFDPNADFVIPSDLIKHSIVFTGAMDYWANVNAVLWFVEHVWPCVLAQNGALHFYVVGANPSREILALHGQNNIIVTGRVDDVRPYIAHTLLSVAPLQIARGIQNKVLEALAMAKPIVLTSMAAEGIASQSSDKYLIEDNAQQMAQAISATITQGVYDCPSNREFVQQSFSWESEMHKFTNLLLGD